MSRKRGKRRLLVALPLASTRRSGCSWKSRAPTMGATDRLCCKGWNADESHLRAASNVARCRGAGARAARRASLLLEPERLDCAGLRARSRQDRDPLHRRRRSRQRCGLALLWRAAGALEPGGQSVPFARRVAERRGPVRAADVAAALRRHARRGRRGHRLRRQLDAQAGAARRARPLDESESRGDARADARATRFWENVQAIRADISPSVQILTVPGPGGDGDPGIGLRHARGEAARRPVAVRAQDRRPTISRPTSIPAAPPARPSW